MHKKTGEISTLLLGMCDIKLGVFILNLCNFGGILFIFGKHYYSLLSDKPAGVEREVL